jgi:hypothetical protein
MYPEVSGSRHTVRIARALIEKQRRLAYYHDALQPPTTLWVSAELDKRLSHCTTGKSTHSSGKLRRGYLCFEPEFAVVEHAREGFFLQSRSASCPKNKAAEPCETQAPRPECRNCAVPGENSALVIRLQEPICKQGVHGSGFC